MNVTFDDVIALNRQLESIHKGYELRTKESIYCEITQSEVLIMLPIETQWQMVNDLTRVYRKVDYATPTGLGASCSGYLTAIYRDDYNEDEEAFGKGFKWNVDHFIKDHYDYDDWR